MSRRLVAVVLTLLCAACTSSAPASSGPVAEPAASPGPTGSTSDTELRALLLSAQDLPALPNRRESAVVELTTSPPPQLSLCRPPLSVAPHQLASVIAKPSTPGAAQLFELVSVFTSAASASAAFDAAVAAARGCTSYDVDGITWSVLGVRALPVAGGRALQYRLMTAAVLGRDTRTLVQKGRFFVLISGFGAPAGGQSLLAFEAAVAQKAAARLR